MARVMTILEGARVPPQHRHLSAASPDGPILVILRNGRGGRRGAALELNEHSRRGNSGEHTAATDPDRRGTSARSPITPHIGAPRRRGHPGKLLSSRTIQRPR
jgi:hypothetical protein